LVERFHDAGKRLTSRVTFGDAEMGAADRAQKERIEVLQELVDRTSVGQAATVLAMTAHEVEEELRVDRTIE
jgi:predicted HTH domain antitoxin